MANSRLRGITGALLIGTSAVALTPALALAARPISSASYTGHGTQYYNNTPNHAYTNRQRGRAQISFKVASNGQRVLNFAGAYTSYCVSGTSAVTDNWIAIDRTGFFSVSGSYPTYGYGHQRVGMTYATVKGEFFDGGHRARIFYKVTTRFTDSKEPPCGTEVRGTVRTA
jgi:hypothetical protein